MSGKLDQSLDDIMKTTRTRNGGRRRPATKTKVVVAPTGGIGKKGNVKTTKNSKAAIAAAILAPSGTSGTSKIVVSGLPPDVAEAQIKDYFAKTISAVRKATVTYGPNGKSRGIATIIFNGVDSAAKAAKELNGVKVDNRPMKIEVLLGASEATAPIPVKSLKERIVQPKGGAKGAKAAAKGGAKPIKATTNGAGGQKNGGRGGRVGRGGRGGGRNAGRGKAKTADELDAEMTDYFVGGTGPGVVAAPAAVETSGGDTGMTDEIM